MIEKRSRSARSICAVYQVSDLVCQDWTAGNISRGLALGLSHHLNRTIKLSVNADHITNCTRLMDSFLLFTISTHLFAFIDEAVFNGNARNFGFVFI